MGSTIASWQTIKDSYEALYRRTGLAGSSRLSQTVLEVLRPPRGARVLDVACGEGGLVRAAQAAGLVACGIDLAEAALRRAGLGPTPPAAVADAEHLPFPAEAFECVTCIGSLENMRDPWCALAEIRRVLTAEGRLCVMVPNAFWLGDIVSAWRRGLDSSPFQAVERRAARVAWRRFLIAGGWRVERETGYNRPAELMRAGKMKSVRKYLATALLNRLTPLNLSLEFIYVCRKAAGSAPQPPVGYWLWEADQRRPAGP